jgi:hypothetical protein
MRWRIQRSLPRDYLVARSNGVGNENSDKAVMRVPIRMNGTQYWYQFDTGADVVMPYGAREHVGWTTQGIATRIPGVEFGGMSLPVILAVGMKDMPDQTVRMRDV